MTTSVTTTTTPSPAALRAELEDMIVRDLLGPIGGERERIPGNERVSDWYAVGMLAPRNTVGTDRERDNSAEGTEGEEDTGGEEPTQRTAAKMLLPSAFGLSFALAPGTQEVRVSASWGHYQKIADEGVLGDDGKPTRWWQREPIEGTTLLPINEGPLKSVSPISPAFPNVQVRGICVDRPRARYVTLFLVNDQEKPSQNIDEAWLFQPSLIVEGVVGEVPFISRAEAMPNTTLTPPTEEAALELLYRDAIEFATGHSVAVEATRSTSHLGRAERIQTVVVPRAEVPRTEAPTQDDIPALAAVELDMAVLAKLDDSQLVVKLLPLADAYVRWLDAQQSRIDTGADGLREHASAAVVSMAAARSIADRLRIGVELLGTDPVAAEAFRFANESMWRQRVQTIAGGIRRDAERLIESARSVERKKGQAPPTPAPPEIPALADAVYAATRPENHRWRPFQIAFILLNLPAVTDPKHEERHKKVGTLDLLYFPTGGGKTEAYLGLTAYTLAFRRLQGEVGGMSGLDGVGVLMRYTLRLLTAQQFQRATALICACEVIRRERVATGDERWGAVPFRIGMWVGMSLTPNRVSEASVAIDSDNNPTQFGRGSNPIQLTTCPWCGLKLIPGRDAKVDSVLHRVLLACSDRRGECDFTSAKSPEGIPVLTTDEEIYRLLPGLIIATTDKFAQLPWQGPLQMLFGRVDRWCSRHGYRSSDLDKWVGWSETDKHNASPSHGLPTAVTSNCPPLRPPDLIIQDELHLISGPLGSMAGLYETAVDRLCAWTLDGVEVRPKLIASTATIRQAQDQVWQVFWRELAVFPPQVLDESDLFFARQRPVSCDKPGRRYLGICAPGTRLKAIEVRVYVAALAAAASLAKKYGALADPWWTLVGYFGALRELGGMRRMVDDEISNRLTITDRRGLSRRARPDVEELTSRVSSSGIPRILDRLGTKFDPSSAPGLARAIDVLLATNMLSVGVDVPRLGLMVTIGQPKTTAEYIQATSRVGRSDEGPGLVLAVYNWARPRDLSHYETFMHYHQNFYSRVEALSVTPFASRAVDRGLSAVFAALARHVDARWNPNGAAQSVDPIADKYLDAIAEEIAERGADVAGVASANADLQVGIQKRREEWSIKQKTEGVSLVYRIEKGATLPLLQIPVPGTWDLWTCPSSLRTVEAEVNLILDEADGSVAGAPPFLPMAATDSSGETSTNEDELDGVPLDVDEVTAL
jgi:hypothetical protein